MAGAVLLDDLQSHPLRAAGYGAYVYLGSDYSALRELETGILSGWARTCLKGAMAEASNRLGPLYIEYTGAASVRCVTASELASPVLNRSMDTTAGIFTKVCHLAVAGQWQDQELLLVCEEPALYRAVCASYPGVKQLTTNLPKRTRLSARGWLLELKHCLFYFRRCGAKMRTGVGDTSYTALVSWIDRRNFSGTRFSDTYFGGLFEHLRAQGHLLYLPLYLDTGLLPRARKWFADARLACADLPFTATRCDMLRALIRALTPMRRVTDGCFAGMDISALEDEAANGMSLAQRVFYELFEPAVSRLAQNGGKVERFIYLYENHAWEKIFCRAVRRYFPQAVLVGYLHTMSYLNMQNLFPAHAERVAVPPMVPHRIVTTGTFSTATMRRYFPAAAVREGPALRYARLFAGELPAPAGTVLVLLVLPIDECTATEMLMKCVDALGDRPGLMVAVKGHPTDLQRMAAAMRLPDNITHTDEPVSALLLRAHCVVNAQTMVAVEALYAGRVPIEFISEQLVSLSRLQYAPELLLPVSTAAEIRARVDEVLSWDAERRAQYMALARRRRGEFLNDPRADDYGAFLDPVEMAAGIADVKQSPQP